MGGAVTGRLLTPPGCSEGPLPTHYEPQESPFDNLLYSQQRNPVRQVMPPRESTATTPSTGSPAPTSSPSRSPPTGSPSTTRPVACRGSCPTSPSSSRSCSA